MAQEAEISRLYNSIMDPQQLKPTWTDLFISFTGPFEASYELLKKGTGPLLQYIRTHPLSLFSPSLLKRQFSAETMPWYMGMVDESMAELKQDLVGAAEGVVLEIGAGTGETLKYYDMESVKHIYGVEPDLEKCAVLRAESERLGMKDKYQIIPFGIEKTKELEELGISPGSVDTVVAVCSLSRSLHPGFVGYKLTSDPLSLQHP